MDESVIGSFYHGRYIYYVQIPNKAKKPQFSVFCSNPAFSALLRFDKPSYWVATGYSRISDKLDASLINDLTLFFRARTGIGKTTYWDKLISVWNKFFPDNQVDSKLKLPDYTKLVYDKDWLQKNFDHIRNYRNDFYKKYEESLPKYDIACINVQGGGQEAYSSLSPFSKRGYAIVAAAQGADNCHMTVYMQRPLADFDPADAENEIEEL